MIVLKLQMKEHGCTCRHTYEVLLDYEMELSLWRAAWEF